jgi:diguanylate cyclase (GGDEF)-like protein
MKAKILLVEDHKTQAERALEFLEKEGYEVILVENAKAAIKEAKSQPFDVILLDLVLPDMSGNEVCRWLKLDSHTKGIPIVMLTSKDSIPDKVAGLEAGADDCLPKPYNELELNARIYACLRTKALQDELKEKNRQLEELLVKVELLSITDPLTEIYNRRHFETIMKKEFARVIRYNIPLTCLIIDVDYFKRINDTYGHQTGDSVLKEIAQIISDNLRKEIDTVARWGGEEFIVLLPETKKEHALNPASRILKIISEHKFSDIASDERITVSIGIASAPDPFIDNSEKFTRAADNALYEATEKGRNRIEIA